MTESQTMEVLGALFSQRAAVVYGHARGGTNILWNLLGSHPKLLMTQNELNEIFGRSYSLRAFRKLPLLDGLPTVRRDFQQEVRRSIARALNMPVLGELVDGVAYHPQQLKRGYVLYKGVNLDSGCHSAIARLHPEVVPIILLRHPVSVIAGHIKRGWSFEMAAKRYQQTLIGLLNVSRSSANAKVVDFSTVVSHPFELAQQLYAFLGLEPQVLEKVRLKAKRRSMEGTHQVMRGLRENDHYWVRPIDVPKYLDARLAQPLAAEFTSLEASLGFCEKRLAALIVEYELAADLADRSTLL